MTLRAGSFDASKPRWTGIIRDDGFPAYRCLHTNHENQAAATKCARDALAEIKRTNVLPMRWVNYQIDPS